MKAKEVLKLLKISRQTLYNYVKKGLVEVTLLRNGDYDYNSEFVYKFLNKDIQRKTVIYARVSTNKQKRDLENQIELLKNYAFMNGLQLAAIYSDISFRDFFWQTRTIFYNEVVFSQKT